MAFRLSRAKDGGAVKCEYNGIKFKSKIEMFCYKELEKSGLSFSYEDVTIVLMDGFRPIVPVYKFSHKTNKLTIDLSAVRATTYTPDFVIIKTYPDETIGRLIIECKGVEMDNWKMKWKILRKQIHSGTTNIEALFVVKNQGQVKECIDIIKVL